MLHTLLLVMLILLLIGSLPNWGHVSWGYGPSGAMAIVLLILVFMILTGRV